MLAEIGKMYWLPEKNTEIVIPYWYFLPVLALVILAALWLMKKRKR
jgi:hypothetical protein